MKEIVVELAEDYVRSHEEKIWLGLHSHKEEAEHKAISCGCPNCKREAVGAEEAFSDEAYRVFGEQSFPDPEPIPRHANVYNRRQS